MNEKQSSNFRRNKKAMVGGFKFNYSHYDHSKMSEAMS